MHIIDLCCSCVHTTNNLLAFPVLIIFLAATIIITLKLRFIQIRGIPTFMRFISQGISEDTTQTTKKLSPITALLSALASTIGMGTIVGPAMAIGLGGPGALFWLLCYIILGSAVKFCEVTFAIHFRRKTSRGDIVGGPSEYLQAISPALGLWYALITLFLFTSWSCIQINTLSCIWAQEGVSEWVTSFIALSIVLYVMFGGVQRMGAFARAVVPLKFVLYIVFALLILIVNYQLILPALYTIVHAAFNTQAAITGGVSISLFEMIRHGIYKGIFITEAGIGTSSISQALSDARKPTDQALLALYSSLIDFGLCLLSGLLTVVTGVWKLPALSNTLIYEVFKSHSPLPGSQYIFLGIIMLFILTALMGDAYNGGQSFSAYFPQKYVRYYYVGASVIAFASAFVQMSLLWDIMDILLVCVAIPHIMGIIFMSFRYAQLLEID